MSTWPEMPNADLRGLSTRRPWAGLVMAGVKPVENRTWGTTYRGLLVIHAGQRWEERGRILAAEQGVTVDRADSATGYLGAVRLRDVHIGTTCCGPWGEPHTYHWVLENPVQFSEPIPGKGRLGLFVLPAEVLEAVSGGAS